MHMLVQAFRNYVSKTAFSFDEKFNKNQIIFYGVGLFPAIYL